MNIQGINPMMMAPMQAQSTSGSSASGSSSSSGTSGSDLQSTFLNLLVTELQNQDPTSPVDPTQMVSQMVSLNQLDQLISINQTLSDMTTTTPTATSPTAKSIAAAKAPVQPVQSQNQSASIPSQISSMTPQDAAKYSLATGTSGLMNLYSSFGAPATNSMYNQTGAR